VQPIPAAAAVTLGALAGYVDAVAFSQLFGVFPANQSGNAIVLGISLGDPTTAAWRPAVAIVGFAVGIAGAVALQRAFAGRRPTLVLVLAEAVLLAAVALLVGDLGAVDQLLDGIRGALLLLAASFAMGVQTEVIRAHAGVSLSTTYQTGVLVQIAERSTPGGHAADRPRAAGALVLLGGVLVGYVGGAALGAALGRTAGWALAVPAVVLAALATTERWWGATGSPPPT